MTKIQISPIASGCTSTRLRITQNLVEELFLCILYYFEVKRTLFGKYRKKNFKMMIFTKKIHHRPFESFKNRSNHPIGLKI
jgi:hypothetical protein